MEITRYDKDTAFRAVAAAAISKGQLVGFDSNGKLVLADADAGTPVEAVGFALTDLAIGDTGGVAQDGELYDSAWTWTPGAKVYTSGTAGGYTATRPANATNLVQPVGHAKSATRLMVRVCPAVAVVQAADNSTVAFG